MSAAYYTSNDEILREGIFDYNNIGNTTG